MEDAATELAPVNGKALRERGSKLMERIRSSEKRESDWRNDARAAETAYMASRTEANENSGKVYDFNILHSNVETIVPAIYNSTPIPDVRPRRVEAIGPEPVPPKMQPGQMPDPRQMMAFQAAAAAYQAKKQADEDVRNYGRMVEGAISVQIDDNRLDVEVEGVAQTGFIAGRGIVRLRVEAADDGTDERITFEAVSWRDYREGPAKRWNDVPWVAFRVPLAKETYDRFRDAGMVDAQETGEAAPATSADDDSDDVVVWEYWDKLAKKVCFVRESDGIIIREEDDPLGLPGFFPCPEPMQPIGVVGKRTPVVPFTVYRALADELDQITRRITRIMKGLKVRGIVAGKGSKVMALADADDNEIVVEDDLESLIQAGGLDKAIAWWPVNQAIAVLMELYKQREAVKASIYEITGISDIVRGASNAGETATAQQIKTQWGSLRIQKMQRLVERMVRDVFVMMAHIISTKFQPATLMAMTGIEITEGIQALMSQPVQATYRVDIESDSTVRADLTRQKGQMSEFLAGSAQFFATAGPLIQAQPAAAEPLAEIYSATSRMFKLGKQAEDALDRFVALAKEAAENPPPNPAAEAQKAEMAVKAKETESKIAIEQQKLALEERKMAFDHQERMAVNRQVEGANGEPVSETQIMMAALNAFAQSLNQSQQMLMAGLENISRVVSAPKRVDLIRDANGRAQSAVQVPQMQQVM